jgi:hypothetical protein
MNTTTYPDFYHPPKLVLKEEMPPSLFTGRRETLQRLWDWVNGINDMLSNSLALMSPRRYGKTVLLQRLFNVMFSYQDRVAPFYLRVPERDTYLEAFADEYLLTFLKHFSAFFLRDESLLQTQDLNVLHKLLRRRKVKWILQVLQTIESYQRIGQGIENVDKKLFFAVETPARLCAATGKRCLVIIDEFQDMNRRLYRDAQLTIRDKNVTGIYRSLAESKIAPMLVAGSMLSMLTRVVLGGGLFGRFVSMSLPLMSEPESGELMDKLAAAYGVTITPLIKQYLFALTKGNPYYITYLVNNPFTKDLSTKEKVDEVYLKQTTMLAGGHFYDLWLPYFQQNMELLNDDQHGKRLLYYILNKTENEGLEQIPQKQIAADLNIPQAKVMDLVKKFEAADLLHPAPQHGMASGFKDTVMLDCLRYIFYADLQDLAGAATAREAIEKQIEWLWQEIERINGSLNYFYGVKGEEQIRERMASWQGEWVDGQYFGAAEKVFLPRFDPASFSSINLRQLGLRPGEIDIYAEYVNAQGERAAWAVEVRRQDRAVSLPEAAEFHQKLEALQQHKKVASLQGWIVSQHGFSKAAMALLAEKGIYYSVIPCD